MSRREPPSERRWSFAPPPRATEADVLRALAVGPASEGAIAFTGRWGVSSVLAALFRLQRAGRVRITAGPAPKWALAEKEPAA